MFDIYLCRYTYVYLLCNLVSLYWVKGFNDNTFYKALYKEAKTRINFCFSSMCSRGIKAHTLTHSHTVNVLKKISLFNNENFKKVPIQYKYIS